MAKKPDSFYFDNYVACADLAVQAAELALRAGPPSARATASATSPMDIFK